MGSVVKPTETSTTRHLTLLSSPSRYDRPDKVDVAGSGFGRGMKCDCRTVTFMNSPPKRNTTLNDTITLGHAGVPDAKIANGLNTLAGQFCYVYA
jgi:hypothetical protein